MADERQSEAIANFMSIAGCDKEFAMSFLEANAWSLEMAVSNFLEPGAGGGMMGGGGGGGGGGAGAGAGGGMGANPAADFGFEDDEPRAAIAQYRDTLIDPAMRVPQRAPPAASAANHPLEAFRDFRSEGDGDVSMEGEGAAGEGGASGGAHSGGGGGEVFGLAKKPKNLAEIYRAPTELCFVGTFEELREAGRREQKWLLVNIQSPTEFASQRLNADTWTDETLRTVIDASFLFWQQYHDSPDGQTFCRFYLPAALGDSPSGLPHIAVVDPITGASVKTWTGFKDAERLMDKLMDYADEPPQDTMAMLASLDEGAMMPQAGQISPLSKPPPAAAAGGSSAIDRVGALAPRGNLLPPLAAGDDDEQAALEAAIAASLEGGDAARDGGAAATDAAPQPAGGPTDAEIDAMWGGPPGDEAADGYPLKVRLLDGSTFMRKFSRDHTFRDVLAAIHFAGPASRLDPTKEYKLAAPFGGPKVCDKAATLGDAGIDRGNYTLSEA